MKKVIRVLVIVLGVVIFTGGLAVSADAQRRGGRTVVTRRVYRPAVYPRYLVWDPYWGGYRYFWSPFDARDYYENAYRTPYQRYLEQKYYLERELRGNRRELEEHLRKYRADGVITAKEQKELDDDYRDVSRSREKLREFKREN